jgi:hypothetical protein
MAKELREAYKIFMAEEKAKKDIEKAARRERKRLKEEVRCGTAAIFAENKNI